METIPLTDPELLTQLLDAINSDGYGSEKIDRIISAAVVPAPGFDGDDTVVIAQSGIKQVVFLMNDSRPKGQTFQSRILNPDALGDDANFAEYDLDDDLRSGKAQRDDIEVMGDALRLTDPVRPWIEQLSAGLDQVKDLSEFAEYLTKSWDTLDSSEFRDRMSQAMTIASMAGYLEAGTDATD